MKEPEPVPTAHLFPEVHEGLIQLLSGLSIDEWLRPTANPNWTVKDVAAHLLGGDIANISRRRDRFHGTPIKASSWDELVAGLNDLNESWVVASRRFSPRMLIEFLRVTGPQLNDYFASLDPYAIGSAVSWAGPEPAPAWLDIAREYTERWHHQQQIRDAVGKPGLSSPRHLSPVIRTFVRAFPHAYRSVPAPVRTRVRIVIEGPSGSEWSLVKDEDRWRLYVDSAGSPSAEVRIPEEAAWKLLSKTMKKEQAISRSQVTGERALWTAFFDTVAVIA